MANDENKIILEFPATNVEIEFGETITFDNISGFLNSDRVTYNGESLTEEIAHLENDKADTTYVDEQLELKADKATTYTKTQSDNRYLGKTNPSGTGYFSLNRRGSTGDYSVSVGWHNEASAQSSFAEGENNASSGYASHSEGYGNAASGLMAHAEGVTTESSGYGSHSEGVGTIANHIGQHAIGTYNVADPSTADPTAKGNYIEIVGNGTDDNRRRNARTLDWRGNEMLAGDLTFNGNKSLTSEISRLDGKIDNLPAPMIFKGTLGVGGTIQSLPTASASNEGFTYKVITDGTYAGQTAKVGDVFTSNGSAWVLIPSGDEDNDTWRAIKINGVEKLGNGISSGAVDFVGSENIEVEFDGDGNKIGVKTKNIYTKEEVDEIIYNILPTKSASGAIANFNTSLALPLKSLEADINAVQDLHGYDAPWVGGAGKNKLDETLLLDQAPWNLITIEVKPNTVYTCSTNKGIQTETKLFLFFKDNDSLGGGSASAVYSSHPVTITSTSDGKVYISERRSEGEDSFSNYHVQIEEGSTATSWEPYSNICPITGFTEANVTHTGINQWDEEWEKGRLTNGIPSPSSNQIRSKNFCPLKPNTTYYLYSSKTDGGADNKYYVQVVFYDKTQTYISGVWRNRLTFTSPSNAYYFKICTNSSTVIYGNTYNNDISINYPATDTEYHAFEGETATIDFDGETIFKALLNVTTGLLMNSIPDLTDLGTLTWQKGSATGYDYFYATLSNAPETSRYFRLCENYSCVDKNREQLNDNEMGLWNLVDAYNIIVIRDDSKSSLSANDFKTAMSGVMLAYELATPIEVQLTAQQIEAIVGTNNIYADTGDCAVEYKCSVAEYVANHSGGGGAKSLGGVFLGGNNSGSEEETTEESEETEKTKLDEPKEEVKEEPKEEKIDEPITRQER